MRSNYLYYPILESQMDDLPCNTCLVKAMCLREIYPRGYLRGAEETYTVSTWTPCKKLSKYTNLPSYILEVRPKHRLK